MHFKHEDVAPTYLPTADKVRAGYAIDFCESQPTPMVNHTIKSLTDRLLFGVMLVEPDGQVVMTNEQAMRIVERADGLEVVRGVVRPIRSFERLRLSKAIAKASDPFSQETTAVTVGRLCGRFPYAVLVIPLPDSPAAARRAKGAALLAITDFEARGEINTDMLRNLFGLSAAEARLAAAIAQGQNLHQISIRIGRSMATLRTQLSTIRRKLGVKRQIDIVRFVLSIPAVRG